ncbi:hypothetical protein [Streptomyces longispororuber]|uniref:hypothetical protein n=1 Tax=Streptomyces longispororuber TaxID=68230 RepID=UPI0036F8D52B
MSALAVEAPCAPELSGRLVVRAAGRPDLHIAGEGVTAPAVPVFTVPLECVPDAERAPGVRPWDGPVTQARLCPACLRSLRGEPEPPQRVPAAITQELPAPASGRRGRRLWVVPEPQTYAAAPLPAEHAGRPVTWGPWRPAPAISHYDPSCEWCGDPAHGEMTSGRQTAPRRTFLARRCTACQLMTAYEHVGTDLRTIAHHKSRAPKDCNR